MQSVIPYIATDNVFIRRITYFIIIFTHFFGKFFIFATINIIDKLAYHNSKDSKKKQLK